MIALLVVLVPILCTIMWGDGSDYVSKFASLFTSDIETGINEGYEAYRDENAKNPVVDLEQVEQYFDDASQWVGDKFSKPVFPEKIKRSLAFHLWGGEASFYFGMEVLGFA